MSDDCTAMPRLRQVLLALLYSDIDSNGTKPVTLKSRHSLQGCSCQFITDTVVKTPPKIFHFQAACLEREVNSDFFLGHSYGCSSTTQRPLLCWTLHKLECSCPKRLRGWKDKEDTKASKRLSYEDVFVIVFR